MRVSSWWMTETPVTHTTTLSAAAAAAAVSACSSLAGGATTVAKAPLNGSGVLFHLKNSPISSGLVTVTVVVFACVCSGLYLPYGGVELLPYCLSFDLCTEWW